MPASGEGRSKLSRPGAVALAGVESAFDAAVGADATDEVVPAIRIGGRVDREADRVFAVAAVIEAGRTGAGVAPLQGVVAVETVARGGEGQEQIVRRARFTAGHVGLTALDVGGRQGSSGRAAAARFGLVALLG